MIGSMVGHPSAVTGFLVPSSSAQESAHRLRFCSVALSMAPARDLLAYGGAWWFLGPLTLMPLTMGMGLGVNWNAAAASQMLPSLMGHLIYGALLGLTYGWFLKSGDQALEGTV